MSSADTTEGLSSDPSIRGGDTARKDSHTATGGHLRQNLRRVLLATLTWAVIAIAVALAAQLILVSLVWGPTRRIVSLLLATVWVGLLLLLVLATTRYDSGQAVLMSVLGFVALGLPTVLASQLSAYTPPIRDVHGKLVPGSIATLERRCRSYVKTPKLIDLGKGWNTIACGQPKPYHGLFMTLWLTSKRLLGYSAFAKLGRRTQPGATWLRSSFIMCCLR